MHSNPFSGFGKVIGPDRIRGREQDLNELVEALANCDQNVSLVGQPRIGKSSLACAALAALPKSDRRITATVTVSSLTSPAEFFRELLDSSFDYCIANRIPISDALDRVRQMPADESYAAYVRCKRGLQQFRRDGHQTLLICDEFDAILALGQARETILRFRELIYHQHLYDTSALIVSRRSVASIEGQIDGVSTLAGVLSHVMFLRPLDRRGFEGVVDRCGPEWCVQNEEREQLWAMTGGHPFLTEMVLYYSWPARSIEAGRDRSTLQFFQYYSTLRELHEADGLFDALIQCAVGPRWSTTHSDIQLLGAYGLIDDRGLAFSAHYQEYLVRCSREAATMDLWRETEIGLRDFIEEVSARTLGQDWQQRLPGMPGKEQIERIFDEARRLQAKDQRSFGTCSPRLLDYLYPMELWDIVVAQWNVFAPLLPVSGLQGNAQKTYWRERFQLFAKIRNPQMHHRDLVIPQSEMTTATGYCQEILKVLRSDRSNAGGAHRVATS